MKTIAGSELRDHLEQLLRRVASGERLRIVVDGRPVADLVPVAFTPERFVLGDAVAALLERAPLDPAFERDIATVTGATIDEL